MTAEERLNRTLLQQSGNLKKLYDELIKQLSRETAHSVTEVRPQELYKIAKACNASEKKKVQALLDAYSKAVMAVMQQGIINSVTLAVNGQQTTLANYTQMKGDAVDSWRTATANAFIESRMKRDGGLNLSDRVWNYTEQTKSEFEAAISCVLEDGIKNGIDAETLGRRVRKYLNEPDMMYRRYHRKLLADDGTKIDVVEWRRRVIGEDGKVHFVKEDLAKVGTGVYRSARQNGLRLAITETNMAYNYANCKRWSEEPFVLGIRIRLSGNHPENDICDELQGEYPKDFMWRGWHPRCRCSQSAILMDRNSEEWEHLRSLPKDEYKKYVSPNAIKGFPSKFNKWIERNEKKLLKAVEKGKLPYFVRDNIKAIGGHLGWNEETISKVSPISSAVPVSEEITYPRTKEQILAAAEARHAARTPEEIASIQQRAKERAKKHALMRKTADDVLKDASDYHDVDSAALSKAIEDGNLDKMYYLAKQVKKQLAIVKKDEAALSKFIPNVHEWKKQFTSEELHSAYDWAEKQIKKIKSFSDFQTQKEEIDDAILWNKKIVSTKNKTWKVRVAALEKQRQIIDICIQTETLKELPQIQKYVSEHKNAKKLSDLLTDIETALTKLDTNSIGHKADALNKAWTKLKKSNATRDANKSKVSDLNIADLEKYISEHYTEDFTVTTQESYEAVMKMLGESTKDAWQNATDEQRSAFPYYTNDSGHSSRILSNVGLGKPEPYAPLLDAILDGIKTKADLVLRSGQRFCVAEYVFGEDFCDLLKAGNIAKLNEDFAGTIGTNKAYMSTSFNEKGGFAGQFEVHIFAPKGTHCINLNELSYYGHNRGVSWDGVEFDPTWSSRGETEIFLHRGYKWKFVRAEEGTGLSGRDRIYIQLLDRTTE